MLSPKTIRDGVANPNVTSCMELVSGADPAPRVEKNDVGGVLPDESKNLVLVRTPMAVRLCHEMWINLQRHLSSGAD